MPSTVDEGFQGFGGTWEHHLFQGTEGYLRINLRQQGISLLLNVTLTKHFREKPGAIIGNGDRKSGDSRAPMIRDNFSIFRTNCAILTSYIRADSRTCQGLSREVVTLREQMVRVERFSCVFYTAMAGNKAWNTNQGAYM